MTDWTDSIVGERMALDKEFSSRVRASEFTSQEWSLVMTAIEFEIVHPDDPDRAEVVVDDSNLDQIVPELDTIREQMQGMGGASSSPSVGSGGGVIDSVKRALGLGGDGGDGDNEAKRDAAAALADEYATELQMRLEQNGRWQEVRAIAATTETANPGDGESDA